MQVLSWRSGSFRNFLLAVFSCLFGFAFLVPSAEAAFLQIRPASGSYELGDEFTATVEVNPEREPLDGVSAEISFDPKVLFVVGVADEVSVIDEWDSEPTFSNSDGTVSLSGSSTEPIRVTSALLTIDFRVVGRGLPTLSFIEASATTNGGESVDLVRESLVALYKVSAQKPFTYTTVTTVSSGDLWSGLFSEAVMLNLGLLIVLLVFLGHLAYVHRQFKLREKRIKRETAEIHEQMTKIFSALRDEIYDQVRSITKRSKLTRKEADAVAGLNQALEVSETLIDKEINDVKNLLD